ncbi:BnaAnng12410D [Brassica napus]|uniref:BnaAnng12410D protein n=1 Tax=Brassica napus TaxID=3708 RepID=A0A078IWL3_BRANA|nr:BnaAnng12410D [Brassica napus]
MITLNAHTRSHVVNASTIFSIHRTKSVSLMEE